MDAKTLRLMAKDPREFRARLNIMTASGPKRLKDVVADFQLQDFAALDKGFVALSKSRMPPPHKPGCQTLGGRYWLERTKGASKDTDLAVELLWLLAFTPRPLTCQIGAADQQQANELRLAALDIVRVTEWLQPMLDVQANAIVNQRTGSRADILTADASGSHGARPHLVILNELTHISRRDFAATLMDNAAKMPGCIVVVMTNAGHIDTWQAKWRENAQSSERWYFSAYTQPAPWLDPSELQEARKRNSFNRYARLWLGQWVSESGTALREDDIAAAVTQAGPAGVRESGWRYYAGLDIGLSRDASALAIVAKHVGYSEAKPPDPQEQKRQPTIWETIDDLNLFGDADVPKLATLPSEDKTTVVHAATGRYRLVSLKVWRPEGGNKVSLDEIEKAILAADERYGLAWLGADPYQAAQLLERIGKRGVPCGAVDFTGPNLRAMASATLEAFTERLVELYPDDTLLADLRALRAVEKSYGVRLESPRTAGELGTKHGDSATALCIGLHVASQRHAGMRIDRPLICWPN